MTLFERLKREPLLQDTQTFVYLLLSRLSISEVVAASKFKKAASVDRDQEPRALIKVREQCNALNYSEPHTDTIVSIFKEMVTLAKLIQTAWLIQSKGMSDVLVKREAISLAHAITLVEITDDNILSSVRERATLLTGQILESLTKPENIEHLECVTSLLKECFPHIDAPKLEHAVATMMSGIDALNELDSTVIIDIDEGEAVERTKGLRENSVFKSVDPSGTQPSTEQINAKTRSICTIS